MPITEWKCTRCGARFELLTLGGAKEEPVCEECGAEGKDVEKQLSRFAASGAGGGGGGSSSSGGGCAPGRGFT